MGRLDVRDFVVTSLNYDLPICVPALHAFLIYNIDFGHVRAKRYILRS